MGFSSWSGIFRHRAPAHDHFVSGQNQSPGPKYSVDATVIGSTAPKITIKGRLPEPKQSNPAVGPGTFSPRHTLTESRVRSLRHGLARSPPQSATTRSLSPKQSKKFKRDTDRDARRLQFKPATPAFSFGLSPRLGRSRRIDDAHSPGPGAHNPVLPPSASPRYSIAFKPKATTRLRKEATPGPIYDHAKFLPTQTSAPSWNLGSPRPVGAWAHKSGSTPGAGAYSVQDSARPNSVKSPSFSFARKKKKRQKAPTPGPGHFGSPCPPKSNQRALAFGRGHLGSRIPPLDFKRLNKRFASPGPGHFVGAASLSHREKSPAHSMSPRRAAVDRNAVLPGPADYSLIDAPSRSRLQDRQGPAFSMRSRTQGPQPINTPPAYKLRPFTADITGTPTLKGKTHRRFRDEKFPSPAHYSPTFGSTLPRAPACSLAF